MGYIPTFFNRLWNFAAGYARAERRVAYGEGAKAVG